ncbi:MAG: 8-amino-7-oxononanoate synthase [Acidobacteriota bacterium]|nr:8-amino-7-oxononanoate synthase [Acidobacteriota bacterium]
MDDHAGGLIRARIEQELRQLSRQSQLRRLTETVDRGAVARVNLMSNDYLCLSRHPLLRQVLLDGIRNDEAVASTGSRLLSGNSKAWEELENEFAAFAGAEAALFFNSGYAANIGLLGSLLRPGDVVFSDSSNHASLIDGMRLSGAQKIIFPHLDLNALEEQLASAGGRGGRFIVVESVFSMEGDRAPLRELAALAVRFGAELIVDEAHAAGVFGPEGRGLAAEAGLSRTVLASIFPCGKALATCGAFVACSEMVKELLINRARTFIFSTALPPYIARQIHAAIAQARSADAARLRLRELSRVLRAGLRDAGLDPGSSDSQIVPVILGSNEAALDAADYLRQAGYLIRAIRPPSVPRGTARLRISLNSDLPADALERLPSVLSARLGAHSAQSCVGGSRL